MLQLSFDGWKIWPCQPASVWNEPLPGGGACSQDPLTFLDFIPCSPLLKPLVPKNDFSSCSLDPQNYCAVPLIPRNFYPCSPYLFTCFTFLFIVKEIAFEPPLSSPCNPFMLKFIDRHFCQLNWLSCLCDSDDFVGMLKHNSFPALTDPTYFL